MHIYEVVDNQLITATTLQVSLRLKEGVPLMFQPGQYAAIHGYKGHRPMPVRCFSIVSSPTNQQDLVFAMRVKGRFTKALAGLKQGNIVSVIGPFGGFVLHPYQQKKIVMLAGGIGITPFMSMIRFASATTSMVDLSLLYSAHDQNDVPFAEEIKKHTNLNPHFKTAFVIGTDPVDKFGDSKLYKGRITPEVIQDFVGNEYGNVQTAFYICGPPQFMKGMMAMLRDRGVARSRIITEAFSQGPNRQTGKVKDWPFSVYAMSTLALAAGGVAVMVNDMRQVIPPDTSFLPTKQVTSTTLTNNRQADLDDLVNSLAGIQLTGPDSDNVKSAEAATTTVVTTTKISSSGSSSKTTTSSTSSNNNSSSSSSGSTSSSSSSGGSTSSGSTGSTGSGSTGGTTTPPPPVCTTTQSGVTKC